jgi:hypothetical protein
VPSAEVAPLEIINFFACVVALRFDFDTLLGTNFLIRGGPLPYLGRGLPREPTNAIETLLCARSL